MKKLRARAAMAGAPISVTEWMSLGAIEFITAQGVDTGDDDAIMKYLEEHKTLPDRSHQTQALAKLRNVLKWPQDALIGEEALQRYLQKARDVVGLNQVKIKSVQKQMIRILVEKLPEYFVMTYSDFEEENPDVKDLIGFEEAMNKYISSMSSTQDKTNVGKTSGKRKEDGSKKARSVSPVRSEDFEDPAQIVVPNKAYTVTKGRLEVWNADTSSCLETMDIHPIPVFLADSEMKVTTTKKGYIELRVRVDDGTPVYFGQVVIYLVPAPWKDFLIGREHLRRFNCLPEEVLQNLTKDERTKYAGKGIEDEEHVSVKASVARCAALGNADEHDKYEVSCKKLGILSLEPILFSDKEKDIFPDMDNIVGGDQEVVSEEELKNEKKEEGEIYPGEKADILAKFHEMVKQMKDRTEFTMEFYSQIEDLLSEY
eukprot:augustus_masked-scaffold_28-processed-gene-3.88-mRNA-1 protein AED:1.00 eAED:1.00 QI:0/0/0/0/1/1/4/0/427